MIKRRGRCRNAAPAARRAAYRLSHRPDRFGEKILDAAVEACIAALLGRRLHTAEHIAIQLQLVIKLVAYDSIWIGAGVASGERIVAAVLRTLFAAAWLGHRCWWLLMKVCFARQAARPHAAVGAAGPVRAQRRRVGRIARHPGIEGLPPDRRRRRHAQRLAAHPAPHRDHRELFPLTRNQLSVLLRRVFFT